MRKLILAAIGVFLIIASVFLSKKIIDSKNRTRPVPKKVVKTVFVETVKNKTIPIIILQTEI